jgi:hypothetical protein
MTKAHTTLTVDADVLRAVKVKAVRSGKGDSEVIEEARRRDLGLSLLDRFWATDDLPPRRPSGRLPPRSGRRRPISPR